MARELPHIEIDEVLAALHNQQPLTGIAPPGVQQIVTVRDGDSLTIGLHQLVQSQPGVIEQEELFWGTDESRECVCFATSREALIDAIADSSANINDPAVRTKMVDASSSLYSGRNGELVTTIPRDVHPSYVPLPDGARSQIDVQEIPTPDIPDPSPGMIYLLVAQRYNGESRQESVFFLLPIYKIAELLTPTNIKGDGSVFQQPLITQSDHQARVLLGLTTGPSELAEYYETLQGTNEVTPQIEDAIVHSGSMTAKYLCAVINRLENVGGAAFIAD